MKLLDYLKIYNKDADYYDTDYDASVTVCYDDIVDNTEELDPYDCFCWKLYNSVQIKNESTVFWSHLIINNMKLFKEFTDKYWINTYEDDEAEFIYQWIRELHAFCSGAATDDIYLEMISLLDKCVYIEQE